MKRRIVALCLMLVMILPIMISCGENGWYDPEQTQKSDKGSSGTKKPSDTTSSKPSDTTSSKPSDTTPPDDPDNPTDSMRYKADLPEIDFSGYQYRILDFDNHIQNIEDYPVTIVDLAIYKRNNMVEYRFNIDIETKTNPYATWWENTSIVQRLAASEAAEYDLVTLEFKGAYAEVLNGNVVAACDLPRIYIDTSEPWHHQSLNDSATVDGVCLFDFTAMDVQPGGNCLIFNKDLADELNLEDPYDLVDAGTWTYDDMWAMARAAMADFDNTPDWTEDDRYGFFNNLYQMTTFVQMGTGEMFVNLSDGEPSLNKSEGLISVLMDATEQLYCDGMMFEVYWEWDMTENSNVRARQCFANDQALFLIGKTDNVLELGDMKSNYGILPYPKRNADQSRYYVDVNSCISLILSCHPDFEAMAIIKEALAVETLNFYYPAYYEQMLKNRYLREERDLDMLKIITDSAVVDLGNTVWYAYIRNRIAEDVFRVRGTAFAGKLDNITPYADVLIDNLMDFVNSKKN